MARNLDILVGLVVQGWERGALNAEEVVRTLQRVELEPDEPTSSDDARYDVDQAMPVMGEPGEFVFGGATFDPKPAKPE